jgi:hypothetical protein
MPNPTVIILDKAAAAGRLPLSGIVGPEVTFTDADVRAEPSSDRYALERLKTQRFVEVTQFRIVQRDATYTLCRPVPVITTMPAPPVKKPPVPPKAKNRSRPNGRH